MAAFASFYQRIIDPGASQSYPRTGHWRDSGGADGTPSSAGRWERR